MVEPSRVDESPEDVVPGEGDVVLVTGKIRK